MQSCKICNVRATVRVTSIWAKESPESKWWFWGMVWACEICLEQTRQSSDNISPDVETLGYLWSAQWWLVRDIAKEILYFDRGFDSPRRNSVDWAQNFTKLTLKIPWTRAWDFRDKADQYSPTTENATHTLGVANQSRATTLLELR